MACHKKNEENERGQKEFVFQGKQRDVKSLMRVEVEISASVVWQQVSTGSCVVVGIKILFPKRSDINLRSYDMCTHRV